MKHIPILLCIVLLTFSSLDAQPKHSIPLRYGDLFTYRNTKDEKPLILHATRDPDFPDRTGASDTVQVWEWDLSSGMLNGPWGTVLRTVNPAGNVMRIERETGGGWEEMFPASAPVDNIFFLRSSSGKFDTVANKVVRRFDTTVFGRRVGAYSFASQGREYRVKQTETTIADSFGILRKSIVYDGPYPPDTVELHSCILNGTMCNWEPVFKRSMNLCDGNVYQFYANGSDLWNNPYSYHATYRLKADTIIDGFQYFSHSWHGSINVNDSGLYSVTTPAGSIRQLLLPGNATIGTPVNFIHQDFRSGIVVDTSTTFYEGMKRRTLQITLEPTMGEGQPYTQRWMEGIGLVSVEDYDVPFPNQYYLNYADICGTKIGGFVSGIASARTGRPVLVLHQNHPNPFTAEQGTSISFSTAGTTAQHVTLRIHDLLGRQIATMMDKVVAPGDYSIPFKLLSITPGVYFFRLQSEGRTISKTMVVTE